MNLPPSRGELLLFFVIPLSSCHSRSLLVIPLSSCHSREGGNLFKVEKLILPTNTPLHPPLGGNSPFRLQRDRPTPPYTPLKGGIVPSAFSEMSKGGITTISLFVIPALFLSFPRRRESKNLQYFN
jgi:hypothetical protein